MVISSSRILSKSPVPVTTTDVGSTVPSMKSMLLEPVIFTSLVILAKVESMIVISPDPAVSNPISFPAKLMPSNSTFLDVRGPYLYAAPLLFVIEPVRSPPKFLT